jgi:hypothetical protein
LSAWYKRRFAKGSSRQRRIGIVALAAQATLLEVLAKQVSPGEASRLTGKQLPAGEEYMLLRGVVLNEGTGHFQVGTSGRTVYIGHDCLGHQAVPMVRKALVAVLPALPEAVYTSCHMDE